MPVDDALHLRGVGREQLELEARVALAELLDEVVRLLRQPAGVDDEDADARVDP